MATPITTNATHAEQQLLEVAGQLVSLEQTALGLDTPPIAGERISIDPDFTGNTVTITATLPITTSVDADGGMSFDVNEVL